jgi:hypothetical protein
LLEKQSDCEAVCGAFSMALDIVRHLAGSSLAPMRMPRAIARALEKDHQR